MNIGSTLSISSYILEKGGVQAVEDGYTLMKVYQSLTGGQPFSAKVVITQPNIDALYRVLKIIAAGMQDPAEKPQLVAFIKSLG